MESRSRRPGAYARKRRHNGFLWVILILEIVVLAGLIMLAVGWFASDPSGGLPPGETQPKDAAPPEITGVRDLLIYQGDEIDLLAGITASDDSGEAPELTASTGGADPGKAGSYAVTYTASDRAGNTATETCTLTVLEKKAGYKTLEEVYAAADERLEALNIGSKSPAEQVRAIYTWARTSCSYSGHTERTDYLQAGYSMLMTYTGDCYGYFSVCKLLFERLNIPNMDVRKVKNSEDDSDHFWSLVSVDGGENWYHFDATPRIGSGDDFCLVTDAFLDAYSDAHKGSHNRDRSLYPKTPEEGL